MCGIIAIITDSTQLYIKKLPIMLSLLNHRGPDYASTKQLPGALLGHTRLKIIDLSDSANQPMESSNNRYVIVYNGEIYNYIELKNKLRQFYSFKTKSDTEVLLAAWQHWGSNCLDHLQGMFAFCIYDKVKSQAFFARDRFGQKPLYYAQKNGALIIASEIKPILAAGIMPQPNEEVWARYLLTASYDDTEGSFFKGINQLMPGEYATFSLSKGLIKERYYELANKFFNYDYPNKSDVAVAVKETMVKACQIHMRSDVPVGIMLSGGLDSSSMLASLNLASLLSKNTKCYSVEFGSDFSEKEWINQAAHSFGLNSNISTFEQNQFFDSIKPMIWHLEAPVGGLMNCALKAVMENAKRDGTTVLLDGTGPDEAYGGYQNHHNMYLASLLKTDISKAKNAIKDYASIWGVNEKTARDAAARELENYGLNTAIDGTIPVKKEAFLINQKNTNIAPQAYSTLTGDPLRDSLLHYIQGSKIPRNNRMLDRLSMAYSLELRLPFLDHLFVELGFNLPPDYYFFGGFTKSIIREAFASVLPDSVRLAKKRSIQAPQGIWLRKEPMQTYVKNLIYSESFAERKLFNVSNCKELFENFVQGKFDNSFFVWQWINTEEWFRLFIDEDPIKNQYPLSH